MNTTPRFLITTADERTWKSDRPVLFLGEWCRRYDRRSIWESMDAIVAPPYGTSQVQHDRDAAQAKALEEALFELLIPMLNQYHQKHCDSRYWKIILGHWLRRFTNVVFNRFRTLEQCVESHAISGTTAFSSQDYALVTQDSATFVQACNDAIWNNVFWSRIQQLADISGFPVEIIDVPDAKQFEMGRPAPSTSVRIWLRRKLEAISARLSRQSSIFIINSYLPKKTAFWLHIALGQFPQLWSRERPRIIADADPSLRQRLGLELAGQMDDILGKAAAQLLWETMPLCYLEGFGDVSANAERMGWPGNPKAIFTSNNFDSDECFKTWTANRVAKGTRYIVGQHGNNYGTERYLNPALEEEFCDKFITWGWPEDSPKYAKGFVLKYPVPGMLRHDADGGLLLVELAPAYQIYLHDRVVKFSAFFFDQTNLVGALPAAARDSLVVRLPGGSKIMHKNEIARWKAFDPSITVEDHRRPISQLIASSRLVVHSYDSTGILETLSQNIPTMAFWRDGYDHLKDEAIPYYAELEKVGIVHFSAESAARKISEVYDDVTHWWFGQEVQSARRYYCEQYAVNVDNPIRVLKSLLAS